MLKRFSYPVRDQLISHDWAAYLLLTGRRQELTHHLVRENPAAVGGGRSG